MEKKAIVALAIHAAILQVALAGELHITADTDGVLMNVQLDWTAAPWAARYSIYVQDSLSGPRTLLAVTEGTSYSYSFPTGWDWQHQPMLKKLYGVQAEEVAGREMVNIPAGEFLMGQQDVAGPEHVVTLSNDFLLGRYEVTNLHYLEALQWAWDQGLLTLENGIVRQHGADLLIVDGEDDLYEIRFDEGTETFFLQGGSWQDSERGPGRAYPEGYDPANHPVKFVSWYGAACYCDWLSAMAGLPPYYNGDWAGIPDPQDPYTALGYRLPTEAEWEYAAQFDDERLHPWGDEPATCSLANFYPPTGYCVGWTVPVGQYAGGASALGLFDMGGNVVEWCNDWRAGYEAVPATDPTGPLTGVDRVSRGGGWTSGEAFSTSVCADRSGHVPEGMFWYHGFRVCKTNIEPELIHVPAGSFTMGQAGVAVPEHVVTLSNDFLLGRYEVTNLQYLKALQWAWDQDLLTLENGIVRQHGADLLIMDGEDDLYEIRFDEVTETFFLQGGSWQDSERGPGLAYPEGYDPANHPVKFVSWYGAACYCDWLSAMAGLPPYYNGDWAGIPDPQDPYTALGYRLPTEAEWEYAAQFDDERLHPWGDEAATCSLANFYPPAGYCVGWTAPVGQYAGGASALGLFDMGGNVAEWCNDWRVAYSADPATDPIGPATGGNRVSRGGGWTSGGAFSTSVCADRSGHVPEGMFWYHGFRVCRTGQ